MSEFFSDSIQPKSCDEIFLAREFKLVISDLCKANRGNRSHQQSIERHSPAEPRAM